MPTSKDETLIQIATPLYKSPSYTAFMKRCDCPLAVGHSREHSVQDFAEAAAPIAAAVANGHAALKQKMKRLGSHPVTSMYMQLMFCAAKYLFLSTSWPWMFSEPEHRIYGCLKPSSCLAACMQTSMRVYKQLTCQKYTVNTHIFIRNWAVREA